MLEIELKSKELREYLYIELNKNKKEPLYDEDLNKITELDLDRYDLIDEQTDVTLEDLVFFNNLKVCYLSNFVFDDKTVKLLNTQKKLDFLQINDCTFNHNEAINVGVKNLFIIDSKNITLEKFSSMPTLEKLHIINCTNTNINGISKFKNLRKIYLQELNLDNIKEITKMPNIAYVNLNGSSIKDNSFKEDNFDFIIEHEEINAIYDSED